MTQPTTIHFCLFYFFPQCEIDLAVGESAFLKDILVGTEHFNHLKSSSDQVWIGNGNVVLSHKKTHTSLRKLNFSNSRSLFFLPFPQTDCQTYNLRTHTIGRTDCQTKLPAVCTNKAPAPIQVTGAKAFGTVIGTRDSNSFRFLGIPYALPPVGALRFRPPEPAPPAASHDARQFGAVCPQETGTDYRLNRATESEDCLFLNVFTPSVKEVGEPSKLPVIVKFIDLLYCRILAQKKVDQQDFFFLPTFSLSLSPTT